MESDALNQIRESRDTIDDLLTTIYRLRDIDRDTSDAELELQTLIEHEFQEIDGALDRLDDSTED